MPIGVPRLGQLRRRAVAPAAAPLTGRLGRADYDAALAGHRGRPTLDRLLALNIDTYLVDDLLVKTDRMSMAHGLEVRSPFLDTELVEFAMRLPPALKPRGLSLKRVLKHAVADSARPRSSRGPSAASACRSIAGSART